MPRAGAVLQGADAEFAPPPSPWLEGSGRLGLVLASLPDSDALVFAAADGSGAAHVVSLRDTCVFTLRGAGVADAVGTTGSGAGKWWPKCSPAVAAAPLPARGDGVPEGLVTAHPDGCVVLWDVGGEAVQAALGEWRQIVGLPPGGGQAGGKAKAAAGVLAGAAIKQSDNAKPTSMPKKGQVDPTGAPHVGGNRWAGGTGGRDTAGLGGRGGPYRLDGGSDIHQLSDELKAQVSPAALAAAREMAAEAHAERLHEIQMTPFEATAYARIVEPVAREIRQLRNVLAGHESRERARVWLGGQSSGELDDGRLVDGLAGESAVYKQRADAPPDLGGTQQQKPKVLRFVLDLSGSMYYFNRYDGRLDRQMQTIAMIFEALAGFEHKYRYSVVGHSGDGSCAPFVEYGSPPANEKERFMLLQSMQSHTQYCQSGDNTLNAAKAAVAEVLTHDADERFVFLLSDANLARYGIEPAALSAALCSSAQVESHALFISSLRDEAEQIKRALPAGRGHICLNASDVPRTVKEVFHARAMGNL
ncbi:hypothetical protein T492DRAFT_925986 [Pavlovales sp. CCMP2436]|nr:hypothetical protein T492DRAFT_925986 [Pavlovales sp. CCMP2436]